MTKSRLEQASFAARQLQETGGLLGNIDKIGKAATKIHPILGIVVLVGGAVAAPWLLGKVMDRKQG